jgi:hypothetical protein
MPPFRSTPAAGPEDVAALRRVLLRLDPWAFWPVELAPEGGASFAVLGVTGAFAVAACPLEGYLVVEGRQFLVDGRAVGGFRDVKRAARALRGRLMRIGSANADVTPVIVLTRASAGAPRERGRVRVLRLEDVVPVLTRREHVLDPSTAERLARQLGTVIAGPARPPDDL